MNDTQIRIISRISSYLEENPNETFAKALSNLNINLFANEIKPGRDSYKLRDIFNDSDEDILDRIESSIEPIIQD